MVVRIMMPPANEPFHIWDGIVRKSENIYSDERYTSLCREQDWYYLDEKLRVEELDLAVLEEMSEQLERLSKRERRHPYLYTYYNLCPNCMEVLRLKHDINIEHYIEELTLDYAAIGKRILDKWEREHDKRRTD